MPIDKRFFIYTSLSILSFFILFNAYMIFQSIGLQYEKVNSFSAGCKEVSKNKFL